MGKVKFAKATTEAFQDLLDDGLVNANTLYFVSDTGDFSPSSLDTDGSLYLGDKLISSPQKPSFYYGVCTVAANVQAKNVTVDPDILPLNEGTVLLVKFSNYNSKTSPKIRINGDSSTDILIKRYGTTAAGTAAYSSWNTGSTVCLIYDGTYWQMVGWLNTTYQLFAPNTNGSAGTQGLVPAPSADTPCDSVLSNQGWKDHLALHHGIHYGGDNDTIVWAKVIEGVELDRLESPSDFTCVILVSKHPGLVNGRNSGCVGFLIVDFHPVVTRDLIDANFDVSVRWFLRSQTLGTPQVKLGVEVVDGKVVVRLYVCSGHLLSYGFKIVSCTGCGTTGFNWTCYRGETGNFAIATYPTLPASANETVFEPGNDVPIAADTVVTQNSANLITSGAVYNAIGGIETLLANI